MNKPKYDYEITAPNGHRYGYIINNKSVVIYINDKEWGSPQGDRFIKVLLEELIKNEKDQILKLVNICNKYINEDYTNTYKLDMQNELSAERRRELELKNCGMRNLRNKLIDEFNKR